MTRATQTPQTPQTAARISPRQNSAGHPSAPRPTPFHRSLFHRSAVRVAVHGALSASAVLGLVFVAAPTPAFASTSASAAAPVPPSASIAKPSVHSGVSAHKHPDFDHAALGLSTTTDLLPEDQATHYQALAGDPVVRVYYLHNRGLLPVDNITVSDPDVHGAVHCGLDGDSTIAILLPLTTTSCWATLTAVPGEHDTTVTASGAVLLFNTMITGEDVAGYTAVVPALSASLSLNGGRGSANLPVGSTVSAVVTVLNSGSVTLAHIAPLTPPPPLSILGCEGGGTEISSLGAGESGFCTGALVPQPGSHVSSVTVAGFWEWQSPITTQGPQAPQTLKVQTVAIAPYTGVQAPTSPPPPPSPPPPSTPDVLPSTPAPPPPTPAPSGVAGLLPPPLPSPTPSRSPSRGSTPPPSTSAPAIAQVQAVSQFRASRGLSLPLRVLVIIIVPAVAAAAGVRRIVARR